MEQAFTAEINRELNRLLGGEVPADLDFEALEFSARDWAMNALARMIEGWLNADQSDSAGAAPACGCGKPMRCAGRRGKRFTTVFGPVTLNRAYYHCPDCGKGFCPRDRALGLEGSSLSPGATRMTGFAAATTSFERSSELLRVLAGLALGAKQVERTAEGLGAEIADDERARVEEAPPAADTMYLGIDGTGLPVRQSEREGHPGKQPDGTAKTREAKLAMVWTASRSSPQEPVLRDPGSVSYSAAVESAASRDTDRELPPFAQRVEREVKRRGFDRAKRQVALGDGALWIWNRVAEQFPRAIQIVDLFHAKERLWRVAHAVYGSDSDLASAWAHRHGADLEAGRVETVIAALHRLPGEEAEAATGYFHNNRHRMRYAKFRRQGLCVSSGVVESGCKRVVGERLKRSGMHWTVDGGNAIMALKCCILSERFEEFWKRRAQATSDLITFLPTDGNLEFTESEAPPGRKKAANE